MASTSSRRGAQARGPNASAAPQTQRKRAKFFPKPFELRPKDLPAATVSATDQAAFDAGTKRSIAAWDAQLRACDPLAKWRLLGAYLARVDQDDPP